MPYRPDSHVVADIALNRVVSIFSECGWACETIRKDYGEDLLVQTNYYGVMDHNKIWVQVKGTRNIDQMRTRKFGYSMDVSIEHALKWARSMDLAIVVLWDVERNFGLWSIPKDSLDEWDWRNQGSRKIKLFFSENSLFNVEQAQKIAWLARIDHYATLVSKARERDIAYLTSDDNDIEYRSGHKSWIPLIAYDFLKLLFIIGNESIDRKFIQSLRNAQVKIMNEDASTSKEDAKYMATIFAVLARAQSLSRGCPLPSSLLEACTEVAFAFVQAARNKKSGITSRKLTV